MNALQKKQMAAFIQKLVHFFASKVHEGNQVQSYKSVSCILGAKVEKVKLWSQGNYFPKRNAQHWRVTMKLFCYLWRKLNQDKATEGLLKKNHYLLHRRPIDLLLSKELLRVEFVNDRAREEFRNV
jgi:hypothetical protein